MRCESCDMHPEADMWACAWCGCYSHHYCEQPAFIDAAGEKFCESCGPKAKALYEAQARDLQRIVAALAGVK